MSLQLEPLKAITDPPFPAYYSERVRRYFAVSRRNAAMIALCVAATLMNLKARRGRFSPS